MENGSKAEDERKRGTNCRSSLTHSSIGVRNETFGSCGTTGRSRIVVSRFGICAEGSGAA